MEKQDIYEKVRLDCGGASFVEMGEILQKQGRLLLAREVILEESDKLDINSYEQQLRTNCHDMFRTLAMASKTGRLKLARDVMMERSLSAFVASYQLPDTYEVPADTYFHVLRYVDPTDHDQDMFYELYAMDQPYFTPQPSIEPRPQDPNVNKKGKLAGLSLVGGHIKHPTNAYVAQLEGTYETLRTFYQIIGLAGVAPQFMGSSPGKQESTQQPPEDRLF